MKILNGKYYLHRWGEGEPGERPKLIVERPFKTARDAYAFRDANRGKFLGYRPDAGRYILNSIRGRIVNFVEAGEEKTLR